MKPDANNTLPPTPKDERELCPHCLSQNVPGTNFCRQCGSPLNAFAAIGPWERLFAEGHIYRTAVNKPHRFIVLLGIWLIFLPTALVGFSMAFHSVEHAGRTGWADGIERILGFGLSALAAFIVLKATRNYVQFRSDHKHAHPKSSPQPE